MSQGEIFITEDGSHSIRSHEFGVSYHSRFGAVQETQHVFINAALRFKAVIQQEIAILDIGFGTGLNAFMTLLEAEKRNLLIQYTAVEAYPIDESQVGNLNYSEILNQPDYQSIFEQLHHAEWNERHDITTFFSFEKRLMTFQEIDEQIGYDIIYFDAFAPGAQPELWTDEIFARMYAALKLDGILTTYCAKGEVKRSMKRVGFQVERLKGPPGKREMTRATK